MFTPSKYDDKPRIEYDPSTRTLQPTVTGSMIVGLKYNKGVLLAADTMGSYGGLRKFKDMQRVIRINDDCLVAASGDLADFNELERIIREHVREDKTCSEHGESFNAKSLHAWLQTIMYSRRTDQDPFWLTVAIAGSDPKTNKPFLGVVDQLGVSYQAPHITTGFGGYIAGPFMELKSPKNIDEFDRNSAEKVLKDALSAVNYRDKMTLNSWCIGHVGVEDSAQILSLKEQLPTNWTAASLIVGYE